MKIFDTRRSGNAWKVRLMAALLSVPLSRQSLSIQQGDLRSSSFLEIAPLGQIPVLQIDETTYLSESVAILFFLAQGTAWWPREPVDQAHVLTWLAFEQERVMKPLSQLRLHLALHMDRDPLSEELVQYRRQALVALRLLDGQLGRNSAAGWVATVGHPSIADVALYPYSKLAPMGGIELAAYPHLQEWLKRMEALPGYESLIPNRPDLVYSTTEN